MKKFIVNISEFTIQNVDMFGHEYPVRKYETEKEFKEALKQVELFVSINKDKAELEFIEDFTSNELVDLLILVEEELEEQQLKLEANLSIEDCDPTLINYQKRNVTDFMKLKTKIRSMIYSDRHKKRL